MKVSKVNRKMKRKFFFIAFLDFYKPEEGRHLTDAASLSKRSEMVFFGGRTGDGRGGCWRL
jgi:hypothetical protein